MKPQHIHDCNHCLFLGRYKEYDLYYGHPTIIARYGSEGSEYYSWDLYQGSQNEAITEAQRRVLAIPDIWRPDTWR